MNSKMKEMTFAMAVSLVILVMLISLLPSALAAPSLTITLDKTIVENGDIITASVEVDPAAYEIYGADIGIKYDRNHLSLQSVSPGDLWGANQGSDYYEVVLDDAANGIIRRGYTKLGQSSITSQGVLLSAVFTVSYSGNSNVNTTINFTKIQLADINANEITSVNHMNSTVIEILTSPQFIIPPKVANSGGSDDNVGILKSGSTYKFHKNKNITIYANITDGEPGFTISLQGASGFTKTFSSSPSSSYSGIIAYKQFSSSIPSKQTTTITIKALDAVARNGKGESQSYTLILVQLADGDVNEDNVVNILDLAKVGMAWNSNVGDANYNPLADLAGGSNGESDGKVDIADAAEVGYNWST